MKTLQRLLLGLLAVAALGGLAGCGGDGKPLSAEGDEPLYTEGHRLEKEGRTQEAFSDFLKLIAKRGDQAPESHLDLGLLYLEQMKDPIEAIHYFKKYLELLPNSKQAPYVQGLIEEAKRDFAKTLPAQPMESQAPRLEMADQLEQLERENAELKGELAALRSTGSATPMFPSIGTQLSAPPPRDISPIQLAAAPPPASPARPKAAKTISSGRTHTVVKGDTLMSIAQEYYHSRSRWRDVFSANRDQLPDERALKIGMVLKIP